MTGRIFDIQHFSLDDGPGIRTTVFFKGCPLHCPWCHNPEGLHNITQLFFSSTRCTGCGSCVQVCPQGCHRLAGGIHQIDRTACTSCGSCAEHCLPQALRLVGETRAMDSLLTDLLREKAFYEASGGGVTLSGGEPMAQPEFAAALLKALRAEGISTCVETSGACSVSVLQEVAPFVNLFLLDIKETDPARHQVYTGFPLDGIYQNLEWLNRNGYPILLRCPVIPGYNDRPSHFQAVATLAQRLDCVSGIHLLPYHSLGLDKYNALGMTAPYRREQSLEKSSVERFVHEIEALTAKPVSVK